VPKENFNESNPISENAFKMPEGDGNEDPSKMMDMLKGLGSLMGGGDKGGEGLGGLGGLASLMSAFGGMGGKGLGGKGGADNDPLGGLGGLLGAMGGLGGLGGQTMPTNDSGEGGMTNKMEELNKKVSMLENMMKNENLMKKPEQPKPKHESSQVILNPEPEKTLEQKLDEILKMKNEKKTKKKSKKKISKEEDNNEETAQLNNVISKQPNDNLQNKHKQKEETNHV